MMKDSGLREMLREVDTAADRVAAMRGMRDSQPKFNILMLQILDIMQPGMA